MTTRANFLRRHVKVSGAMRSWNTRLVVTHQSFTVAPEYGSKGDARWMARMLRIALTRLLQNYERDVMGTMRPLHKRRHRRTAKQKLAHGETAKRRHARPAGRIGSIKSKQKRS